MTIDQLEFVVEDLTESCGVFIDYIKQVVPELSEVEAIVVASSFIKNADTLFEKTPKLKESLISTSHAIIEAAKNIQEN